MRILLDIVSSARVEIDDDIVAKMAAKVAKLRIFLDEDGRITRSVLDVLGGALVVSQFTIVADTSGGKRSDFSTPAVPEMAECFYERFCALFWGENVSLFRLRRSHDDLAR